MRIIGLVLYGVCGLLVILAVVQFFASMAFLDLYRARTIGARTVSEHHRLTVIPATHWGNRDGPAANMTFMIESYDPLRMALVGRIRVTFPEALLTELVAQHAAGARTCDGVLHYDPVYRLDDGTLSLVEGLPEQWMDIRIQEATGLRAFEATLPLPLSAPDRAGDPLTWLSAPITLPVFGNVAAFPEDRYTLPLRIDLKLRQPLVHLRDCTYGYSLPTEVSVIRAPGFDRMRLRAGQSPHYPHKATSHPDVIEFELTGTTATRLQAWSLAAGIAALMIGLIAHVTRNAFRSPGEVGSDLAVLAAAALAIPPMKALIPGPPTAITTRLDGVVILIFIILIATMIWRVAVLLRART